MLLVVLFIEFECCVQYKEKNVHMQGKTGVTAIPRTDHLVGLVVRRLPREQKIPGLNSACTGIFGGSSHTSD